MEKGSRFSAAFSHVLPQGILIRSVRIPAPANPDVISVVGAQSAERKEQVVIICFRTVKNVRAFNPCVVSPEQFFAVPAAENLFRCPS